MVQGCGKFTGKQTRCDVYNLQFFIGGVHAFSIQETNLFHAQMKWYQSLRLSHFSLRSYFTAICDGGIVSDGFQAVSRFHNPTCKLDKCESLPYELQVTMLRNLWASLD